MRCATSCDKDPNCVAFYNNPTTRTCQEQSALSNADMIGLKSSPGFRYYQDCSHKVAVTPTGIHGLWFWVDGTNLNAPVKTSSDAWTTHDGIVIPKIPELWYQDRPNFPNTEHCIQSRFLSFYYKFDDAGCSTARHQVLCEKKISC
ncbi:hypothetical protein ACF0H5_011579 [Mactra antiquata]